VIGEVNTRSWFVYLEEDFEDISLLIIYQADWCAIIGGDISPREVEYTHRFTFETGYSSPIQ